VKLPSDLIPILRFFFFFFFFLGFYKVRVEQKWAKTKGAKEMLSIMDGQAY